MNERIDALRAFLDASVSVYHAVDYLAKTLDAAGYTHLREQDAWDLVPGGKYYMIRGGSALTAFRLPAGEPKGFLISASHSDRPTFKVKANGALTGAYTRLNTERYGGMLIAPWMDRPLSLAGRVLVETENGIHSKLVNIDRDLLLIPNVAIHMNRSVNEGQKWNPAVDSLPLMGGKGGAEKYRAMLEQEAGGRILGHDLFLYVRQKATVWGLEEEYLSAPALDDLECVWTCAQGFLKAPESESIPVLCAFDGEEIGSVTVQGAASDFLENVLSRICVARNYDEKRLLAQSFVVSADNGHALHPNHPELADPVNAPLMNGGVVIKFNSNMRYTTDGLSCAVFRRICDKAGVPTQTFYNRPDIPGGSTLGCISLAHVSVPSIDIGLAQLAMHSCYETAGVQDVLYMEDAMTAYFGTTLERNGDDWSLN